MILPDITEVQRFHYMPGDRFIIKVGQPVTWEQVREMTRQFRVAMQLPEDVPVAILDNDLELMICDAGL